MGLVKTRRLAAMQKQQRAKAGLKPPVKGDPRNARPRQFCVKNILLATRDAGAALLTLRREV